MNYPMPEDIWRPDEDPTCTYCRKGPPDAFDPDGDAICDDCAQDMAEASA